jgi:hypothetical protein
LNEFGAAIRDDDADKFGFFASLPSLLDTEAALSEIKYAFDTLHADGVTIFTRYGDANTYLGNPRIEPIWAELNRRKAVVFVHPTHPVDKNTVNPKMPQPMIDYPHETTRAAMDMIMMGTRRKYPNCTVILSHAGGALPYLIGRVATPMKSVPNLAASIVMGTDHDKAWADFRSFHYDLALSTSAPVLKMVLDVVPHENILYGVSSVRYTTEALAHASDFTFDRVTSHTPHFRHTRPFWSHWNSSRCRRSYEKISTTKMRLRSFRGSQARSVMFNYELEICRLWTVAKQNANNFIWRSSFAQTLSLFHSSIRQCRHYSMEGR